MTNKLRTALYGAAMIACVAAPVTSANAVPVGTLSLIGPAQTTAPVHFDVFLPLRNETQLDALLEAQQNPASAQYHKWLTPAQFGALFGPSAATLKSVASYLTSRGFTVNKVYTRSLRVTGTAAQITQNFGAKLVMAKSPDGASHIVTNDSFTMPSALSAAGAQIFSFAPHVMHADSMKVGGPLSVGTTRSVSTPGSKNIQGYASNSATPSPDNRYSATGPYWFDDLKQAYQYPSARSVENANSDPRPINGTGVTIAALMGSDVLDSDIAAVFNHENWSTIARQPNPTLAGRFYVGGGAPFGNGDSLEASLDTQQELTGAPGANVVLVDVPDLSDGNVIAGYVDIDEYNFADVVSSSFGECELFYFPKYNGGQDYRGVLKTEHELFKQGNSQGITFLASSGDSAGKECTTPSYFTGGPAYFIPGIQTPAADPDVTAVGGTNLVTDYFTPPSSSQNLAPGPLVSTLNSAYAGENAWSDPEVPYDPYGVGTNAQGGVWGAGSGYSQMWSAPNYQSLVTTGSRMRAVPDIGMQVGGCPGTANDYHANHNECYSNNPADGNGNPQRSAVVVAYGVGVGGGFYAVIGTSVSSPELASVVALMVEKNGRMGNINSYIYFQAAQQAINHGPPSYHTGIPGYNGVVNTDLNSAYSLSAGVGTPIVTNFIRKSNVQQAGPPQTLSNP
jgi:subtilase family serine protease